MFVVLPDKVVTVDARRPVRRRELLLLGRRRRPRQHDDQVRHPAGRRGQRVVQGPLPHRAVLGLRVPPGFDRRRTTWTNVHTSVSTDRRHRTVRTSATASPASPGRRWVRRRPDADTDRSTSRPTSAPTPTDVQLRFRYWTDGAAVGDGFQVDDIAITGQPLDGAETDAGLDVRRRCGSGHDRHGSRPRSSTPMSSSTASTAGYDEASSSARTTSSIPDDRRRTCRALPVPGRALIWYWDTSYTDNNVGDHPGEGLILPVDAHPESATGATAASRARASSRTTRPSGSSETDASRCTTSDWPSTLIASSQPAVSVFNDRPSYWVSGDPGDAPADGRYQAEWNSVNNPHTGTTIKVLSVSRRASSCRSRQLVNPSSERLGVPADRIEARRRSPRAARLSRSWSCLVPAGSDRSPAGGPSDHRPQRQRPTATRIGARSGSSCAARSTARRIVLSSACR